MQRYPVDLVPSRVPSRAPSPRDLRPRRRLLALALLPALVACGDGSSPPQAEASTGGPGNGRNPGERVVPVETEAARRGTIARAVTVSGTVSPIRSVSVNSQLSGALLAVEAEEGDEVRQGEVLARLDDREIRAMLRSAEANLEVARSTYERSETLRAEQIITEAEFERDRAALAAAVAQVEQLTTRLGFATVESPVTGVVTEKLVEAGHIVGPQTRLFTVAVVSTMVVQVNVSELDVVQLSPGDRVSVVLDAYPGNRYGGRIRRVFPAADPATRLVPVEVALDESAASDARSGFLARVTFALDRREDVLQVPTAAIVQRASGEAVYVVNGDRVEIRPVTLGVTSEGLVEVRSGLEEGEEIVVLGTNQLRDGATIRRVERPGAGGAGPGGGTGEAGGSEPAGPAPGGAP